MVRAHSARKYSKIVRLFFLVLFQKTHISMNRRKMRFCSLVPLLGTDIVVFGASVQGGGCGSCTRMSSPARMKMYTSYGPS
jgi:hypothetical protein